MKRICCVCNKYLGEKPGPKDAVTHGFCDPCLKIYKAEMMADFDKIDKTMQDTSCVAGGEAG